MDEILFYILLILSGCSALGVVVKLNLDRKHNKRKKLSKRQKLIRYGKDNS